MYLVEHEKLKLPILHRIFPRIFSNAIRQQVAEACYLKPAAFGKYKFLLKEPRSINDVIRVIPSNLQLQIYGLNALLLYVHQTYAMDTNPQLYTLTYSEGRSELLQMFDNVAEGFAEQNKLVGVPKKSTILSARKLLIKLLDKKSPQVMQLAAFNIHLELSTGICYQLIRR